MQIERYGVEGIEGFLTHDYQEAKGLAQERKSVVIAYIFEFVDTEVLDDYREPEDRDLTP